MADNGKTARSGGRESLRKVSISRIKKEMSDVFYLSDDLVISALTADKNTTADYPTSIDGFTAIIMMTGEATVSIDMQNYSIKPNTIVFFNPDSIIRTVKCSSNAAAYLLAFSKSFVNEIQIDLHLAAQTVTFGAGTEGAVEGKHPRRDLTDADAAVHAGKFFAEGQRLAVDDLYPDDAVSQLQRCFQRIC